MMDFNENPLLGVGKLLYFIYSQNLKALGFVTSIILLFNHVPQFRLLDDETNCEPWGPHGIVVAMIAHATKKIVIKQQLYCFLFVFVFAFDI